MKTMEIVEGIETHFLMPSGLSYANRQGLEAAKKVLRHVIRFKNQSLYRNQKETVDGLISQQIDARQALIGLQTDQDKAEKHQESLAFWQGVNRKLLDIASMQEISHI